MGLGICFDLARRGAVSIFVSCLINSPFIVWRLFACAGSALAFIAPAAISTSLDPISLLWPSPSWCLPARWTLYQSTARACVLLGLAAVRGRLVDLSVYHFHENFVLHVLHLLAPSSAWMSERMQTFLSTCRWTIPYYSTTGTAIGAASRDNSRDTQDYQSAAVCVLSVSSFSRLLATLYRGNSFWFRLISGTFLSDER